MGGLKKRKVNNFSVMSGQSHLFVGIKQYSWVMCFAQRHDMMIGYQTQDLSICSLMLYNYATMLYYLSHNAISDYNMWLLYYAYLEFWLFPI